jgi:signal transduction histidine kinase
MSLSRTQAQSQLQYPVSPAASSEFAYRVQSAITMALAISALIALIVYPILAFQWHSQPFIGALLSNTLVVNGATPIAATHWSALEAGIQQKDMVVTLNGEDLGTLGRDFAGAREKLNAFLASAEHGAPVRLDVLRGDTLLGFDFTLDRFSDGDFLIFFFVPYFSALIVVAVGLIFLIYRRHILGALTSATLCFSVAVLMAGFFDAGTSQAFTRFWMLMTALIGGSLFAVGMTYPESHPITYRIPGAHLAGYGAALVLGLFSILLYDRLPASNRITGIDWIVVFTIANLVLLVYMMWRKRRLTSSQIVRDQASLVLLGLGFAMIPGALWLLSLVTRVQIQQEAMLPFLITPSLGLVISMFHPARINSDSVFTRGVAYLILLTALTLGYFLLTLGASLFAIQIAPGNPLLIAAVLGFVAIAFSPVRDILQNRIDHIYYRKARDYQGKLEDFGRTISSLNTVEEMISAFRAALNDTLEPVTSFLFLRSQREDEGFLSYGVGQPETDVVFRPDSGVVAMLSETTTDGDPFIHLNPANPLPAPLLADRARLSILKCSILAGLTFEHVLNGIVSIGSSRSGKVYTYEELRFAQALIGQFAIAVERRLAVESRERRVNELDVLSQVGQALNYTIEFDDLLELISTRTSRLIQSQHFYIALHDENAGQMYFAFYLEDDERYPEKEGQRWRLGDDFFSEIVRTRQPRLIDDYAAMVQAQNINPHIDVSNIKAWMGVPLIAGIDNLGTMAIARTRSGEPYTQEQLRIFGSIGALAATSFERTRLFSELNLRARQLGALNEVSQKLVQAEAGNIETLLQLITISAVDILNAEAGSLLLVADDGSGDMVFRVAIGGMGEALLGQRVPHGQGLVGEVVRTSQPQTSREARADERWVGREVGDSQRFRTNSILAVPLIAKEQTIGVLEVLNKRDHTPFIDEDINLSVTFASQAAIAIENARLFQMTGSQLNKRLEELETLERIDFELNRTLDLRRVAEITIRSAINSVRADAGLLALVEGGQTPQLRVIVSQGYAELDAQLGTDRLLDAERGIASRVLRIRRADLADTQIDPDYSDTLPGSLSQITIPMMSGDDMVALLMLEKNNEPRFNLLDLDFAQRFAEHASIAIVNAQLVQEIEFAAESKSQFVGFAAHELKNPLTSIKGYAALLTSDMAAAMPQEQRVNAISVILSNSERMQGIIDDMRDIAKSDAGKFEISTQPTVLRKVVEDALQPFTRQIADKQQTTINDVDAELPLVMGDHLKLIQVLTNLISNAHKYSNEGAEIRISADVDRGFRDKKGQLRQVLHVRVSDNGIGMAEEDKARLFKEDYFRSDDERAQTQKGTGLGMIITQRIIELHGGEIWVESELNVGTTFHFVIPLAPTTAKPDATMMRSISLPEDETEAAETANGNGAKTQPRLRRPESESASD